MVMPLNEALDKIKNAKFGKVVRPAMHDGILRANDIAEGALTAVEGNVVRQGNLETQVTDMFIEMTDKDIVSAPEIIGSRDGRPDLPTRLSEDFERIEDELSLLYANYTGIGGFGIKGDGVADDTVPLQNLFDSLSEGARLIFPKGLSFRVTSPLLLSISDIVVDFNASKFKWHGTTEYAGNGDNLSEAVIKVFGTVSGSDITILEARTEGLMELVLTSANTLSVGDYLYVTINSLGAWNTDYSDYKPSTRVNAKIVAISGDTVTLDYTTPFKYPDITGSFVNKSENLSGVDLYNFDFEDVTASPSTDTVPSSSRASWVSGIYFSRVVDSSISFVKAKNFKVKAIQISRCNNIDVNGLMADTPSYIGPGCGYGVQVTGSTKVRLNNLNGVSTRHLIDFSASGHCTVSNSNDDTALYGTFDCHGIGEHDITFNNCHGTLIIGNGINDFATTTENINVFNSSLSVSIAFANRVAFKDSIIRLYNTVRQKFANVIFDGCEIVADGSFRLEGSSRGIFKDVRLTINNSTIDYRNSKSSNVTDFANVYFNGVRISNYEPPFANIAFKNNDRVEVAQTDMTGMIMYLSENTHMVSLTDVRMNSLFSESVNGAARFIGFTGNKTSSLMVSLDNVTFDSVNNIHWIRFDATVVSGSVLKFYDVTLLGKISEYIINPNEIQKFKRMNRGNLNRSTLASSLLMTFE